MRDDDFDQRRLNRSAAFDPAIDRRVPGKQTLVDADSGRSPSEPAVPEKRTLVQTLGGSSQGVAHGRDPVVETEFHVRKARELVAALQAGPPPTRERVLRADLRCHVDDARRAVSQCGGHEGCEDAFASVLQLIAQTEPLLRMGASASDPTAVAKRGVEGPGQSLPFQDQIQRAFGSHDVSRVQAHVGNTATDASRELGARAYAHGDHVAFAGTPDLHTAAHEATHVVQQRAGVAFKDGENGDAFEQHADAVADAVVRGESAESLLSSMAGAGAAPARAVVQRKGEGAAATATPASDNTFARYVQIHAVDLGEAVAKRLANTVWPDPSTDAPFAPGGDHLFARLLTELAKEQLSAPDHLAMMLYPGNVEERFRDDVVARGQLNNLAYRGFGEPLAQLFELAAKESLTKRVGPRYAEALARMVRTPRADDLIAGHPMDRLVARAMCEDGVVDNTNVAAPKDIGPVKLHAVEAHWLGRTDPELWNFVQVTPATATVEEVAAVLWADPKNTTMAFAIEKYGDLFRVAPAYARQVITSRYPSEPVGTADTDATRAKQTLALAKSSHRGGDAATHQFVHDDKAQSASAEQLSDIEAHIGTLLDTISTQLGLVAMDALVQPAYAARRERMKVLANADAPTRAQWLPVLSFQHTQLLAINAKLPALVQEYRKVLVVAPFGDTPQRRAHDQLQADLRDLGAAAGASHLREESSALVRRVEQRGRLADQNRLDAAAVDLHDATETEIASGGSSRNGNTYADDAIENQRQAAQNRSKVSRYDREKAMTLAGEHALLARMDTAQRSLEQVQAAADAVDFGDGEALRRFLPNAKTLPEIITGVRDHLAEVHRTWDQAVLDHTPEVQEDGAPDGWAEWQGRSAALPLARNEFAKIAGDQPLGEFIRTAVKEIHHQQLVNALVTMAEALLITLATGAGAAAIGRAAAALVADAGALVSLGVDIGVNASINSLVQMAVSGDGNASFGWTMLENAMMDMFTRGILGPMHEAEETAREEAQEIASLPNLTAAERRAVMSADFLGRQFATELVGGMASQWAAHHLVEMFRNQHEAVSDSFALTALQQGAAIGLGKFFHGRAAAWNAHRAQLESTRFGQLPEARALFAARDEFFTDAKRLAESPSPDPAEEQRLNQRNVELERREHALFEGDVVATGSSSDQHNATSGHEHPATPTDARVMKKDEPPSGSDKEPLSQPEKQPVESSTAGRTAEAAPAAAAPAAATPHADAYKHSLDDLVKRAPQLVAEFPHLGHLPATEDNVHGLRRLVDLYDDVHVPPDLREQFLTELKERVGSSDVPPERLHDEMYKVAHAKPQVYLRKGARPSGDHINAMGGLRRAVSLKSTLASLTSDSWYSRVSDIADVPRDRSQFKWAIHADKLVAAYNAGKITFEPSSDLNPSALVKGAAAGSSGWYFSAADAGEATGSPETMQTQLAVGSEYKHGYIILELPTDAAVQYGAAKPTALDLTLSSAGKLNKHPEPVGRTAPTKKGQKEIREVVLPPLPLSVMSKVTFVHGGSK